VLFALAFVTAPYISESAESEPREKLGTLYLKNADYLPGAPLPSDDATRLRWKSPSFREPISFELTGVDKVVFDHPTTTKIPHQARVALWNGNLFYGQVVSMDNDVVVMQSQRHGVVKFIRSAIQRIDGLGSNAALLVDGLTGLSGWSPYGEKKKTFWNFDDGRLFTEIEYANLYRRFDHDGPVVLEIELESKGPPKFLLALGIDEDPRKLRFAYSLEVWDSQLVAHRQAGDDFKFLAIKLPEIVERHSNVKLEIFLDPQEGRLLVYSQGQLRGEFRRSRRSRFEAELGVEWIDDTYADGFSEKTRNYLVSLGYRADF